MSVRNAPVARNYEVKSKPPRTTTTKNGTRITGHELVQAISGSVAFEATKIEVNPGLKHFTWLSGQALGWEKYKFISLEAVYVPSNAVTTTPGTLILGADFDAEDPVPADYKSLSTYEVQRSSRVYEAVTLNIPSRRMNDVPGHKFIRDTPVAANLSLYDPCSIIIATQDCANGSPIGQIWVNYVIELISPQSQTRVPTAGGVGQRLSVAADVVDHAWSTVLFPAVGLGSLPINSATPAGATFVPPKGIYEVSTNVGVSPDATGTGSLNIRYLVDGAVKYAANTASNFVGGYTRNAYNSTIMQFDGVETFNVQDQIVLNTGAIVFLRALSSVLFKSLDR